MVKSGEIQRTFRHTVTELCGIFIPATMEER